MTADFSKDTKPQARRRRTLLLTVLAGIAFLASLSPLGTRASEPQLVDESIPGLYQRILTRPDARLMEAAGSDTTRNLPPPFTPFYVFAREDVAGSTWLAVGPNRLEDPTGWLPLEQTVSWDQAMVLAFNPPTARLPVLFFKDRDSLLDVVQDERLPVVAPQLVEAARSGRSPADDRIISIEPEEWVDLRENFYLLPILRAEDTFLASGARGNLVEIASIPKDPEPSDRPETSETYRVGVMFVVDTTTSMKSYIDRTRQAVSRVFRGLRRSAVGERISFGMVAYRDSLRSAPELEYLTKLVAPLQTPPNHDAFEEALSSVEASLASSAGFNEDGLAGVVEAIGQEEWKDFAGRYIIFLSDAGLRDGSDPYSATRLNPSQVNELARDKNIAIVSMLLATPMGSSYHEDAERQLRELSFWEGMSRPAFYRVPEGDLRAFEPELDRVVTSMIDQITAEIETGPTGERDRAREAEVCDLDDSAGSGLTAAVRCAGYAQRLVWLGRERGAAAPALFRAWAPDFALDNPNRKAFSVRVMLTKEQLSNLATALDAVLTAGRETLDSDPGKFFDQLRSVVARTATDPSSVDPASIDSLADLLDAYLQRLPYHSQLLTLSEESWLLAGPARQAEIIATVRSKTEAYQHIHDSADWIRLSADASDDELIYPLPLELLP